MYLLYLTICTTLTNPIGFKSIECIVVTPANYATKSLCVSASKSYIRSISSSTTKVTINCEKYNDR